MSGVRYFAGSGLTGLLSLAAAVGCGGVEEFQPGHLETDRARPDLDSEEVAVTSYTGDNAIVQAAQTRLFDGFALHANVIHPTCGPISGVCHNAKEYPDLHTPANFLEAIGAPCNVQPGSHESVYDRCEQVGDRLDIGHGQPELEVAYIEYIPGETDNEEDHPATDAPGLHIYLAGTLAIEDNRFWGNGRFMRAFVNDEGAVQDLPFFTYESRFWVIDDGSYRYNDGEHGTHLLAQVREYQTRQIEELLSVGIQEGDKNRNGILGARVDGNPVSLISVGNPAESYLVARMRGVMEGDPIPGSRMPLANEPLDSTEMLSLFCFIEGLAKRPGPVDLSAPIDYGACSYSQRPEELELLGSGVSWDGRIERILEFNCAGCHGGDAPAADLNLRDGDVHARLLASSSQRPELKLIEPGQPAMSYLFKKIEADPSILGAPMPMDPLNGDRRLDTQEIADVRSWIEEGALPGSAGADETDGDPQDSVAPDAGTLDDAGM